MSRRVKNAMVPHVARWRGQNACLFTFAPYEGEARRTTEGRLEGGF